MVLNIFFTNIDTSSPKGAYTSTFGFKSPWALVRSWGQGRVVVVGGILHVNIGYLSEDVQMVAEVTRYHLDKLENGLLVLWKLFVINTDCPGIVAFEIINCMMANNSCWESSLWKLVTYLYLLVASWPHLSNKEDDLVHLQFPSKSNNTLLSNHSNSDLTWSFVIQSFHDLLGGLIATSCKTQQLLEPAYQPLYITLIIFHLISIEK